MSSAGASPSSEAPGGPGALAAAPASAAGPGSRAPIELALDVALAATLIGGALHQGLRAWSRGEGTAGMFASIAPSLVAGALVLVRQPARGAGLREIAAAAPSLVLAASIPLWVAPPSTWTTPLVAVFAAGAIFTCWSLVALGRSFAVLPAPRTIVARGPYRLVRHPVYAGQLVMFGAACATLAWPAAAALLAAAAASLEVRARAEERILGADPAYRAYAEEVRGRLVPLPSRARWRRADP